MNKTSKKINTNTQLIQSMNPKPQPAQVPMLAPSPLAIRFPSIVLVGNRMRTNEVGAELKKIGFEVKKANYLKEVDLLIDNSVIGIMYVAPLLKSNIRSVHKTMRRKKKYRDIPFFAIVPEWVNGRAERQMYKEGIRMLFEWPKEKNTFTNMLSTAYSAGLVKVKSDDPDKALAKAILNRLSAEFGRFKPEFTTHVYNGIVMMRGRITSATQKKRLVDTIKKIPGVRGVVDTSLVIVDPKASAKEIKTTANKVLENVAGDHDKTLEVQIRKNDQKIILVGTAAGKTTVNQAKKRLENLYGIRKVEDKVIVSPRIHQKDLNLAKKAQRLIKKMSMTGQNSIKVKVMAGIAHLKGNTSNGVEAYYLVRAVRDLDGIDQVYNKIEVNYTG